MISASEANKLSENIDNRVGNFVERLESLIINSANRGLKSVYISSSEIPSQCNQIVLQMLNDLGYICSYDGKDNYLILWG